jgi:hypothetical protein
MPQALPSPTFQDDRALHARKRLKPADALVRAATTELLRRQVGQHALEPVTDVLQRQYSGCQATNAYLQKTASTPAMTGVATWAAELVATSMADFMASEMPASAFAQLSTRVLTVPPIGLVKVPSRASPLALQGMWVGEGSPKPVVAFLLGSVTVSPFKLSAVSTFSEEMILSASIEQLVRQALAHDLTGLLDTALLDSTAASSVRPAGLFNGVTPLTASTATPSGEAMFADLRALAAAVSTGHPDARVIYIANPQQAGRLAASGYQAVASGYMSAGSVAAVDGDALVLLVGQPRFALSRNVALHMESATPLPLATGAQGSGVVAVPMRSSFQEDWVGLRCVLLASWAKRRSGAAAIVTGATW